MSLNEYGKIAHQEWFNTLSKRTHIELDEFIVMPNHIHGIVKITQPLKEVNNNYIATFSCATHNLSSIIRGYKSAVSSQVGFSVWQRNFYEHIIRDEKSYLTIAEYIENNPILWEQDRFFIEHQGRARHASTGT